MIRSPLSAAKCCYAKGYFAIVVIFYQCPIKKVDE